MLLDDGLQNPRLSPRIAPSRSWMPGNASATASACLPARCGPVAAQMRYVDAVLAIGDGPAPPSLGKAPLSRADRAGPASSRPAVRSAASGLRGIGRPGKFFDTLRDGGLTLAATRAFADHHPFTDDEIAALRGEAAAKGLALVTTREGCCRLPAGTADIAVLPITLSPEAMDCWRWSSRRYRRRRSQRPSA